MKVKPMCVQAYKFVFTNIRRLDLLTVYYYSLFDRKMQNG